MFVKNKNNKTKLYKGVVLGAAGLLCLSFTPVQVLTAMADYLGDETENNIGSEAIVVDGAKDSVVRGNAYEVKNAYFGTTSKDIKLGLEDSEYTTLLGGATTYGYEGVEIETITSDIQVVYSTGEVVAISDPAAGADSSVYGTFYAENAGDYTVRYTISVTYDNGSTDKITKTYETEVAVESTTGSAYMAFADNSVVMPKIYDKKMAKNGSNYKDIELAIPTVYADKEHEVEQDIDDILLPHEKPTTGNTVKITVSSTGTGTITLDEADGKVYIRGSELNSKTSDADNIVVKYSYYVGTEFVNSIEKTITVYDDYYADEDGKSTYDLTLKKSGEHSAVTKVEAKLPTIKAYANEESTDEIAVSVKAIAYRKTDKGYTEKKDGSIVDGKFTPWADGSYRIVFTAEDFYGNTAELPILVENVVDSQKPTVYMYDASDAANDRATGKFVSAEAKLKSKTTIGNVIIYAIGATDNVNSADEMTYKRTIKSSVRTIEVSGYNKYNLIFDYDFQTLLKSNKVLEEKITADFATAEWAGRDVTVEADVKAWLKANNYLIVTTEPNTAYKEADYIKDGLAFVDVAYGENILTGSSAGISYTVSYIATDKATEPNTSTTLSYTISVTSQTDFQDIEAPKFANEPALNKYYSESDVIKFTPPTVSDNVDSHLEKVVYYQYKNADASKESDKFYFDDEDYEIDLNEINDLTLDFVAEQVVITYEATDDYGNKGIWTKSVKIIEVSDTKAPTIIRENYVTPAAGNLQNETITLPSLVYTDDNAGFISSDVKVYHIDGDDRIEIANYGKKEVANTTSPVQTYTLDAGSFIASYSGKYEAVVRIRDYNGNFLVTYYYYDVSAVNVVSGSSVSSSLAKSNKVETGEKLNLPVPTVSYSMGDGYEIYGVDANNSATDYRVVVKNSNNPDAYKIEDNTTFVGYNYASYTYSLAYEINVQIFKTGYGFTKTENGVMLDVSGKHYYMSRLTNTEAHDGDYVLVNYGATGINDIIYGAVSGTSITFYDLELTNGVIEHDNVKYYAEINAEGKLVFVKKGGNLGDYISVVGIDGTSLELAGNGALSAETIESITSSGTHAITNNGTPLTTNDFVITTIVDGPYSVTVEDTKAPVLAVNYDYKSVAEKGEIIAIQPIKASDASAFLASGIDTEKSYVEVAFSGRTSSGSQTSSSYQFYMADWTTYQGEYNEETGAIDYKLNESNNGTYTISYYVFDKVGNPSSGECLAQYKIAVGDTKSPTLKLGKDLLEKEVYSVGDELILDMSAITMSDNVTKDQQALKDTLKVKVTNTTTNTEVENLDEENPGYFRYKIEEVGTYKIEVTITDEAGWSTTQSVEIEVEATVAEANTVSTAVGIVLVVVAVLILAGVVTYFVVSKVKLDKELKKKTK